MKKQKPSPDFRIIPDGRNYAIENVKLGRVVMSGLNGATLDKQISKIKGRVEDCRA
jgi:hypothetical protein